MSQSDITLTVSFDKIVTGILILFTANVPLNENDDVKRKTEDLSAKEQQ